MANDTLYTQPDLSSVGTNGFGATDRVVKSESMKCEEN